MWKLDESQCFLLNLCEMKHLLKQGIKLPKSGRVLLNIFHER